MKTAIVTTLRDGELLLDTFINYHLSAGFDKIFLFFDDKADRSAFKYLDNRNLTVVRNDNEMRKKWRRTKGYKKLKSFVDTECMARQILNANVALEWCREQGIDWLLHIDIDELFYARDMTPVEHFESCLEGGIDMVRYVNHEAVPEKIDIGNVFSEVTLFKKNIEVLREDQVKLVEDIMGKCRPYFNFYGNGKSAVRVDKDIVADTPHSFKVMRGAIGRWLSAGKKKTIVWKEDPCILHYPCCGFDHFWKKYRALGNFDDKWFNSGKDIKDILPIHIAARDVCSLQDPDLARKFYKDWILEPQGRYKEIFTRQGIFFEVLLDLDKTWV